MHPSAAAAATCALLAALLAAAATGSGAIQVKQQQHRSDDQQPSAAPVYSAGQQQTSAGSSASAQQQQQQQQVASSVVGGTNSNGQQYYAPAGSGSQVAKSSPDYADSSEHSYQAAAQSVNMALANSGIFGPSSSSSASQGQQVSANSNQQQANLNPVHYFYYPSKDSQQAAAAPGNNAYAAAAASYPSYTDQFSLSSPAAAFSAGPASPDVAASSQDPSYLPQPPSGMLDSQQQQQYSSYQPQQLQQQQQQQSQLGANSDPMASYSSNQQAQQQQPQQQQQSNQQHSLGVHPSSGGSVTFKAPQQAASAGDYLNSHMNHQQSLAYQSLYNQLNDQLSNSNLGYGPAPAPAAHSSQGSLASYLSGSTRGAADSQQSAADLFAAAAAAAAGSAGFSPAASHLSPASVSPASGAPYGGGSGAGGSLFGSQQQSSQQQASLFPGSYLSPYLSASGFDPSGLLAASGSAPAGTAALAPTSTQSAAAAAGGSGKRFGIGSFIMPVLALAGLSLLIPTMSNIGTAVGRKKRSIEPSSDGTYAYEPLNGPAQVAKELSIGEYLNKLERYYSIYQSALENEHCMDRLVCELGLAVKDVSGKSAALSIIERLVPSWMSAKMHLFKEAAADRSPEAAHRCRKHVCAAPRLHHS